MSDSRQPPPPPKILTQLKALIEKLHFCHVFSYSNNSRLLPTKNWTDGPFSLWHHVPWMSFSDEHYFGHKKAIKRPWGQSITPRASRIPTWYNTNASSSRTALRNSVILKKTESQWMIDCHGNFTDAKTQQNSFRFEQTVQRFSRMGFCQDS